LIAGRYQILERIACGTRSSVFKALDARGGRLVAIKRRGWELAEQHHREVAVLRSLRHPVIPHLLDEGEDAEGFWLTLEYVQGETLRARVERHVLPIAEAIDLARQILEGLTAIHAAGFLHRDLNPENVLIESQPDLKVRLIDFELAHAPGVHPADAATGAVHCMAPEQFANQPLDARTDLYALGVVMHFALTGRFPFEGNNNAQVITAHLHSELPSLTSMPDALAQWVRQLLSRNPDDRPASAEAALMALNSHMRRRSP
jgi:serine/threonine-protein kinase